MMFFAQLAAVGAGGRISAWVYQSLSGAFACLLLFGVMWATPVQAQASPEIESVSPNHGVVTGGTFVTITGSGFTGATLVTFHAHAAKDMIVVNDTTITAYTPANFAVMTVDVHILTASGEDWLPNGFTYTVPPPLANPVSTTVAYNSTDNVIPLKISGAPATSVALSSGPVHGRAQVVGTSIIYTPDTDYIGPDSFTYTAANEAGTSVPATVSIAITAPSITFTPSYPPSGTVGEAYNQTIAGATGGTAPYTYSLSGGEMAPGLTLAADGTLKGTPTTAGTFTFKVTATDSSSGAGPFSSAPADVSVLIDPVAPIITSISPAEGPTGTTVTIHGTDFSNASSLTFGGKSAPFTVNSPTQITAAAPAHAEGPVDVVVTTPGGSDTLPGGFVYGGFLLITGQPMSTVVDEGGNASFTVDATSATEYQWQVNTGRGFSNVVDGELYSGTNSRTLSITNVARAMNGYIYRVAAFSTVERAFSDTAVLTVKAAEPVAPAPVITSHPPNRTVSPGGNTTFAASVNDATSYQWQANTGGGFTDIYDGGVYSGTATPALNISNASAEMNGFMYRLVATGSGGIATSNDATLTVAAQLTLMPADNAHLASGKVGMVYSETAISALGGVGSITYTATGLPGGLTIDSSNGKISGTPTTGGTFTINITAMDASSVSASASYTVVIAGAPPTLVAVSPASGPIQGGTGITLRGEDLTGATSVLIGGIAATAVTVVGPNEITATTPANAAGSVDVSVTTPGGTASLQAAYTYVASTFTFSPAPGRIAGAHAGVAYNLPITVAGGRPAYRFSATGLPEGMGIDTESGTIAGLPTTPGDYTIILMVRDQTGETGSATYLLKLDGSYRPDPARDAEVIGLVNAQAQSTKRFATTQIGNFNDRLERLHNDKDRQTNAFNIRLGLTRQVGQDTALCSDEQPGACLSMGEHTGDSITSEPISPTMGLRATDPTQPGSTRTKAVAFSDTSFWAGGFINFGTNDSGNLELGNTLVGMSSGVDHRFSPDFVAGVGLGYGRDRTEIGESGTDTAGSAISAAIYGSWHPSHFYLDGLLGMTRLDFNSGRFVTVTGGFADGSRNGTQRFGALSAGFEYRSEMLLFSPYGRLLTAFTSLDGYSEWGADSYSLAFDDQKFDMLAGVVGLRVERVFQMDWGLINARSRFEYSHDFSASSKAIMGYADLDFTPYSLTLDSSMRNYLTVELGLDLRLNDGFTIGLDYHTASDLDGSEQSQSGFRLAHRF